MNMKFRKLVLSMVLILSIITQTVFAFNMQFVWDLGVNAISLLLIISLVLVIIGAFLISRALLAKPVEDSDFDEDIPSEPDEDFDDTFDGKMTITLLGANVDEKAEAEISDKITVGRHTENDIVIQSSAVSGTHCIITRQGKKIFITDCNSTNGTFLNNSRVHKDVEVKNKDIIQLGKNQYKVYINF